MKRAFMGALLAVFLSLGCAFADSIGVVYTLSDLGSGQWQYDYSLSGSFLANWGIAICFPGPDYGSGVYGEEPITDLLTGGSDWLTFALQRDDTVPAPGEFDMLALVNEPDMSGHFAVTFYWHGIGAPGNQNFNVFDFTNGADLLESGVAVPSAQPVPEPSSVLLLGTGLVALALRKTKRSSTN